MKNFIGESVVSFRVLIFLPAFLFFMFFLGCTAQKPSEPVPGSSEQDTPPVRIVSTAPSLTETLFAVGAGERVVGVSRFCRYPSEVAELPKVGGLLDPDIERIVELNPDLVLITPENDELRERLLPFQIRVVPVDQSDLGKILDALESVGALCGPEMLERGKKLKADLAARIDAVERRTSTTEPVPVLIAIDRERGNGKIDNLFVAGNNRYFNEILRVCGGRNVFADAASAVPTVSAEAILEANPAVIIDLATDGSDEKDARAAVSDWDMLTSVDAVKNQRVYALAAPEATIPGPRVILLIEQLDKLLQ